ncbi:16S rRNA (cytidine(1402)-2'-O)-methyltransferase [Lachnoanaerobaculum umeaense]|uniref:Ribosomal RNA small subunit methyltransferase I n=1 Tax=Lachnoanaerobaculum umeaense TaxID=617123 RepID=A0A385PXF1_9FIRM|nr:16S rRNA (cytidine(1402)-2'-O)-methyltransferase [Lachnoanaerobaculum umeaense]AYA98811.1 16S rRNA (cytidine(1402)-2'-O)-methyltransferase [Lachnoanaerobaculum umeaense]PZW91583.1 16S rRNA (cytidine1402-2'-O)-methyltransferase [Lachnoanaerobaculum umeaense]
MTGKIYLVATPIGNLSDMSIRAIDTLKNADIIACEDTRNTIRLLNYFEIKGHLTSYHEYNKIDKAYELCEKVKEGKSIAFVSDAGMPAISDPGYELVDIAYKEGLEVTIIPGASAVVSALAISGISSRRFSFEGFLPVDKNEKKEILAELVNESRTIILYEAPHRLLKTLKEILEYIGDRNIAIVRELTKLHEEVLRGRLTNIIADYESEKVAIRGEYVLVIEGKSLLEKRCERQKSFEEISIREHYEKYIYDGMDKKEAMKAVAKDRGIQKRDVYKELL